MFKCLNVGLLALLVSLSSLDSLCSLVLPRLLPAHEKYDGVCMLGMAADGNKGRRDASSQIHLHQLPI